MYMKREMKNRSSLIENIFFLNWTREIEKYKLKNNGKWKMKNGKKYNSIEKTMRNKIKWKL
jgi:hypothetical protein